MATDVKMSPPAEGHRLSPDPGANPLPSPYPTYHFAFADFLKKEYHFGLDPDRPICKAFQQGHCPLGDQCPDRHPHHSNYNNLVCKHWLRGLCKKGEGCEFLHEYNLRLMPECTQFSRHNTCTNGSDCLYLHIDPSMKQPPCAHYERGFCPLGPHCAARHVRRRQLCEFYLAGFCPEGRECTIGSHPVWKEKEDMKKPEVRRILSAEEKEAERQRLLEKLDREREEEEKEFQERGGQRRDFGRGRVLEARLEQASMLKKVVDAIRDLVQDCNFDCNDSGIALQAMDNSHVALVSMLLNSSAFSPFRCDRNIALGINLTSLTKVLRCAQNDDILTVKAEDSPDVVNLVFESSESDRMSEYDIKLMDIDQEHLGIPETAYAATITMPSPEFQRICRDLNALSESVGIECTKEGVKFACAGDIGSGSITLRAHTNVEDPKKNIEIALSEPVALTFSLKYLVNFCKASGLSDSVKLCLSNEVPLLVEYGLSGGSYLRFYLAPKIGDEE